MEWDTPAEKSSGGRNRVVVTTLEGDYRAVFEEEGTVLVFTLPASLEGGRFRVQVVYIAQGVESSPIEAVF